MNKEKEQFDLAMRRFLSELVRYKKITEPQQFKAAYEELKKLTKRRFL